MSSTKTLTSMRFIKRWISTSYTQDADPHYRWIASSNQKEHHMLGKDMNIIVHYMVFSQTSCLSLYPQKTASKSSLCFSIDISCLSFLDLAFLFDENNKQNNA